MYNDIEIMSPVGSYESLMAAIQAGAGSVYFGVGKLNMRAKSSANFTIDDLKEIVRRSREHNVKTYLTANTVIYDSEIEEMHRVLDAAKEAGVTAIIASDMAVINYASSLGHEIHISTQLNVSNIEAVRYYAQFADVIVTARELNLESVAYITSKIEEENIRGPKGDLLRIEIFVHGALCMAISGKCYLSLHERNYSANRGSCLQTCRRSYIVTEKDTGHELEIDNEYIMSPKDLCTIGFLDKVLDAGVKVLKIEGRGRPAEYVMKTTRVYRAAVEAWQTGTYSDDKIAKWTEELATVFNRGFWDGYYMGQRLGEWSDRYGSKATRRKIQIGRVTNYYSRVGAGAFRLDSGTLTKGEDLLISGPTTGVVELKAEDMRVDNRPTDIVEKGQEFSVPCSVALRRSDKLFKVVDQDKVMRQ